LGCLKGRGYSEDLGVDGEDNIKMDLREIGFGDGFIWLRIETSDRLL
jgi:hypothetical protein